MKPVKDALSDLYWAAITGLTKVVPWIAASFAILAFLLVILFALLGLNAYVFGDLKWSF